MKITENEVEEMAFVSSVPENTRDGMLIQVPIKKEMMIEA